MNNGLEIRWHGRGGQGAKTLSLIHIQMCIRDRCHTYNVETALIKKLVKDKKGIPYTVVETDYSQADIEQINTRMAAFIEML